MLGRTDRRLRLVWLLLAFVLAAGAIGARLAYWQVARAGQLQQQALAQLERSTEVPVQRGDIFDRSGTVLLATTGYRDLLAAHPERIPARQVGPMASRLIAILGLIGKPAETLRKALASDAPYVVLARRLTPEQSRAIRAGLAADPPTLVELELEPRPFRLYPIPGGAPDTTLASQLLGFVNAEGRGQYGVEQHYQRLLAGRPRVETALHDASGRVIADTTRVLEPGLPGADLRLTIDASLQLQLEKELYAAWVADRSLNASAVVLHPTTGEVLAWASVPGYDANRYQQVAKETPGRFLDPIVSLIYEPGSVMKMMVAAAAYETDVVKPTTRINDSGKLQIGRYRIDDADKKAMGRIPFEDVIAYSRNVGAARVAMMLGKDVKASSAVLYDLWTRLGIGRTTGVDVAGELPGIAVDPRVKPWAGIDLANRAFGQGVAVTPLQLASSFSTMVNGGYRVQPHVVAGIGGDEVRQPAAAEQVLDGKLSAELRKLMVHVVTEVPWYAAGTLIPRYSVGGKTGTAQIWDSERGAWVRNTFNFSFVGFVGESVDTPRAVIAVRIGDTRPRIIQQGDFKLGITSYELFRRISLDTIGVLDIPPAPAPRTPTRADQADQADH